NDRFTVFGGKAVSRVRSLTIFSRWGSLVFQQKDFAPNDLNVGWDGTFKGKKMQASVFAWMAEVEFVDGEVILYEGDVTVVK
ncbi:MAG: gliding motility-associated C-terminal domain-containing protein, partial [Bacteroidota bacterium]